MKTTTLKLSLVSTATLAEIAPILDAARASGACVDASLVSGATALDVRFPAEEAPAPRAKALPRPAAKPEEAAPYGRRKDGTPRSKPGPRSRAKRGAK